MGNTGSDMGQGEGTPPRVVSPKTGDERFQHDGAALDTSVLDFWRWSASDLLSNATRGRLGEFIVAMSLGLAQGVRNEWDPYDLKTPKGVKLEVKTSAYLQAWQQKEPSKIIFGIAPTFRWDGTTGKYDSTQLRQADVYVFCVLGNKDDTTVDPLNLDQWRFWVLPTRVLNEKAPTQKSITLSTLERLGATKSSFGDLAHVIDDACPNPATCR